MRTRLRWSACVLALCVPSAAADYYTKAFTTSVKTTFNGDVAVRTVNGPYVLFAKVNAPPPTGPQSAIWHFGWNTPDSRAYLERFHAMRLAVVPMYADPESTVIEISSDALPNFPTTARVRELRTQGIQPARVGGFQYLRGPDGSLVENAGNFPSEFFNAERSGSRGHHGEAEARGRESNGRHPPLGHGASGDDRGTGSRRDRAD